MAFVGPVVEAVAIVQQLQWHQAHPDTEPVQSLLVAHAGIYGGIALGLVGAASWLARPRWRVAAAVALAAGLVRLSAVALDLHRHAAHVDALPAHDAYKLGLALALAVVPCALAVGLWAPRERKDRETDSGEA